MSDFGGVNECEARTILEALADGPTTTGEVRESLGRERFSMAQARYRLRKLEAAGLVDWELVLGPAGFATLEWTLTPAGEEPTDAK